MLAASARSEELQMRGERIGSRDDTGTLKYSVVLKYGLKNGTNNVLTLLVRSSRLKIFGLRLSHLASA